MWDLKPFSIYTLCSQEKNYVFLMWDNFFLFHYLQHVYPIFTWIFS